jgi:hypothetical protein
MGAALAAPAAGAATVVAVVAAGEVDAVAPVDVDFDPPPPHAPNARAALTVATINTCLAIPILVPLVSFSP